jgi:hypothetical protein
MTRYEYLAHHGILGQKWGIRRYQNEDGTLKAAGKQRKKESSDSEKSKEKNQFNKKKALAIAGSVAAVAAIGAIGYYAVRSNTLDKVAENGKNKVTDILGIDIDRSNKPAKVATIAEMHEASSNVNPSHSNTNCGACSSAVVVNLSGHEKVYALEEAPEHMRTVYPDGTKSKGYDPDKLIECFESGEWKAVEGLNRRQKCTNLENEILSYGEGTKGIFYADARIGGLPGHYFSWTVSDNKVCIIESQPPSAQQEGIIWNSNLYDDVFRNVDPEARVRVARLDVNGVVNVKPEREQDLFEKKQ